MLADFRLYSLMNQALMWLVIGAVWACLTIRKAAQGAGRTGDPHEAGKEQQDDLGDVVGDGRIQSPAL